MSHASFTLVCVSTMMLRSLADAESREELVAVDKAKDALTSISQRLNSLPTQTHRVTREASLHTFLSPSVLPGSSNSNSSMKVPDGAVLKSARESVTAIATFFGDASAFPADRTALKMARGDDGSGMKAQAIHKYLKTNCLRQRHDWATELFAHHGCRRVIEFGGYLSPLPDVPSFQANADQVEMYVNIDPSIDKMRTAEVPNKQGKIRYDVHIPATFQEFGKAVHEGGALSHVLEAPSSCVFWVGGRKWADPLVVKRDENFAGSLASIMSKVKMAVVEYSEWHEDEWHGLFKALSLPLHEKKLFSCTHDADAMSHASNPNCKHLTEEEKEYSRNHASTKCEQMTRTVASYIRSEL